jgi:hypothetical protein
MNWQPVRGLAAGERALVVTPRPSPEVDGWSRRLRFWAGRSLSATALVVDSHHRVSTLARATGLFAPGVVRGLELTAREDRTRSGTRAAPASDWWLHVRPGLGLAAGGEDVALPRALRVALDDLPIVGDPAFFAGAWPAAVRGLGVVLLQPVEVIDEGGRADAGLACSDPSDDAYSDRQRVDAVRLVWHPWPSAWLQPPARGARFRNLLAHRLFAHEADRPGEPAPWHALGVPLACVDVSGDGNIQFVDRHLVVRGGGGAQALPMHGGGGPALWQARVDQFADHLADLSREGVSSADAEARFHFLPPFAVIPTGLVDLAALRTDFLPPTCRVQAVPVPQEQLELVLERTAALAPIDLVNGDECTVFVPVPQRWFDPRLLFTDSIADAFLAAIRETGDRVAEHKQRRAVLRGHGFHVRTALSRSDAPAWPADDPGAIPGEPAAAMPAGAAAESDHGAAARAEIVDLVARLSAAYPFLAAEVQARVPLAAWQAEPGTPAPNAAAAFGGLLPWIADLQDRIRRGNDAVNYGFLRAQSEIYRVRQVMLGNVEATRLAVNPALASIVQGESARATKVELDRFFGHLTATGGGPIKGAPAPAPAAGEAPMPSAPDTSRTASVPPVRMVERSALELRATAVGPELDVPSGLGAVLGERLQGLALGRLPFVGETDITGKRALVGKIPALRTTTIADRIAEPPAPEAKNSAVAGRLQIVAGIARLHPEVVDLAGLTIPVAHQEVAVFERGWLDDTAKRLGELRATLRKRPEPTPAQQQQLQRLDRLVPHIEQRGRSGVARSALWLGKAADQIRRDLVAEVPDWSRRRTVDVALTDPDLMEELQRGLFDPDPEDGDEGGYFAAAVAAQELAMAALRAVEGRLDRYERALSDIEQTVDRLRRIGADWLRRVQEVETDLAEARHDLGVAKALHDEEAARLEAVNRTRAETLRTRVARLVVARTRKIAAADDVPVQHLERVWSDPLPAALAEQHDLPDELERAVAAWRHAPIAWFTELRGLARQLDRRETLLQSLAEARLRAQVRVSAPPRPSVVQAPLASAIALQRVLQGQEDRKLRRWQETAAIDLARFSALSWQASSLQAEAHLSLDDLCSSSRGRAQLARSASTHLSRIAAVAGALHREAGNVPAAVRLSWAEAISVHDRVVDLHDLSWLPGFAGLGRELRLDMQRLVTWLFGQVEPGSAGGRQLATDLVRVAILLACHAPVGALVTGRTTRPSRVRGGDLVTVALEAGTPRLGAGVRIYAPATAAAAAHLATAVVEDLQAGAAVLRVTRIHAPAGDLVLDVGARAVFG